MKKIAILQSNYIPWRGYFHLIDEVDEFIVFDDAQYTKNDWRNRNKLKINKESRWLTIPVKQYDLSQKIKDTFVSDVKWNIKHWRTISQSYSKARYFQDYAPLFEELYLNINTTNLSEINVSLISLINDILGISTIVRMSGDFEIINGRTERIISICKQCSADVYLSGPSAKNYFNETLAEEENIKVEWADYRGYGEYTQLSAPFDQNLSILDLIFNEGDNCRHLFKPKVILK